MLALLLACAAPTAQDYVCSEDPNLVERDDAGPLQAALDDAVAGGLPGVVLALRDKEGGVWVGASGLADLEVGAPMQTCTPMRVGGVSQMLASAALLSLAEDGQVDLDATVTSILDDPAVAAIPNIGSVTVRHLLSHTSGIADYALSTCALDLLNDPRAPFDLDQAVACMGTLTPAFEPGADFAVSSSNYALVHGVLEAITGRSAAEVLQSRVAEPLGLSGTLLPEGGEAPLGTARGYGDISGEGDVYDVTDLALGYGLIDGGVVSTASDLTLFAKTLLESGLISTDWLKQMKDESPFGKDNSYGLGLVVDRESAYGRAFGQRGWMLGYTTELWYLPDLKVTVAVMSNGGLGELQARVQQLSEEELAPALVAAAGG